MSTSKLSLEERLKLAASSGSKKKSKLKKGLSGASSAASSRDITPVSQQHMTCDDADKPEDREKVNEMTVNDSGKQEAEGKETEEVTAFRATEEKDVTQVIEKENSISAEDVSVNTAAIARESSLQEPNVNKEMAGDEYKEPKKDASVVKDENLVAEESGELKHENVSTPEVSFDAAEKTTSITANDNNELLNEMDQSQSLVSETAEKEGEHQHVTESENVRVSLSASFLSTFNLSPTYYADLSNPSVLMGLQEAITKKFDEITKEHQQDIDKATKKNVKLNTQLTLLQKEKVKTDLKVEKLTKELALKEKKLTSSVLELDNLKPKFEEVNKLYTVLLANEEQLKKQNDAILLRNKELESQLEDVKSNLNNYELDNDSYAAREAELINELESLKASHKRDISILENKIEHQKIKYENYQLVTNSSEIGENKNYSEIEQQLENLKLKMRQQDDEWFKKYDTLSSENRSIASNNKDLVNKNNDLNEALRETKTLLTKIESDTKYLIENNTDLAFENKNFKEEIENYKNQVVQLQKDFKIITETNRIQAKQLQELFREDKFTAVAMQKKRSASAVKTQEISKVDELNQHSSKQNNEDERKALTLQLQDEWNIDRGDNADDFTQMPFAPSKHLKDSDSMDDSSSLISPREQSTSSLKFKLNYRVNSNVSQQILDIDEEDPSLIRKSSAVQPMPLAGGNNNNIHIISRLSSQVRKLETEITSINQAKEKLAKEKLDQQRKIAQITKELDSVSSFKLANDDLAREKATMADKFKKLEHENLLKERKILELSEDLKDMKLVMNQQIQQMVDMQEKISLNR